MTQAHEPLNIMDNSQDYSTRTKRGIFLSKCLASVILVVFVLSLVTVSLLVYNYAACPIQDQLANVTKYELCHCDHDQAKLLVLPLTTESSKHVLPLETTTVASEVKPLELRLPTTVKPKKYYLSIVPYIFEGNFTFDGEVSIELDVVNTTKEVTFNGVELDLQEVKLFAKDEGTEITILRRIEEPALNFYTLMLDTRLEAGKTYILNISYTGLLNDNLHGFYRSSYEENKVKR